MPSRSARVFVLLAIAIVMSAFNVYRGVKEEGFNTSTVLPPILALLLACGIVAGVLAWVRKGNAWRDAAGLAHSGPGGATLLAIAAGGVALSALAGALAPSGGEKGTAAPPELQVEGRRVTSRPLGLVLDLPAEWERVDVPVQPGANFAVRHAPTNTVLGGFALTVDRPSSLDATLQLMLDQRRAKYGSISDVAWGEERVGDLRARTVAFTVIMGPAGPMRILMWTAASGPYAVGFSCAGPAPAFAASEAKCRSTLAPITIAPR